MESKTTYYVSTGSLNKMYTLRCEEPRWGMDESGRVVQEGFSDHYVCTLAHDLGKAMKKASEQLGYEPEVRAGQVGEIGREARDPERIYFGKHSGKHISEMENGYAVFVYFNMSHKVFPAFWENVYDHFKDAIDAERARFKAEEDARIEAENKREEHIENAQWVGQSGGDRMNFKVTVTEKFSFSGTFGWTTVTKMVDEDGNHLIYWNELHDKKQDACADEGDEVEFFARVKRHDFDRNEPRLKVTVLTRATKVVIKTKKQEECA